MTRFAFLSEEEYAGFFSGKLDRMPNEALLAVFRDMGVELPYRRPGPAGGHPSRPH